MEYYGHSEANVWRCVHDQRHTISRQLSIKIYWNIVVTRKQTFYIHDKNTRQIDQSHQKSFRILGPFRYIHLHCIDNHTRHMDKFHEYSIQIWCSLRRKHLGMCIDQKHKTYERISGIFYSNIALT